MLGIGLWFESCMSVVYALFLMCRRYLCLNLSISPIFFVCLLRLFPFFGDFHEPRRKPRFLVSTSPLMVPDTAIGTVSFIERVCQLNDCGLSDVSLSWLEVYAFPCLASAFVFLMLFAAFYWDPLVSFIKKVTLCVAVVCGCCFLIACVYAARRGVRLASTWSGTPVEVQVSQSDVEKWCLRGCIVIVFAYWVLGRLRGLPMASPGHFTHACGWSIREAKGHHKELKVAIARPKRCLVDILLSHSDLVKSFAQVQLREIL